MFFLVFPGFRIPEGSSPYVTGTYLEWWDSNVGAWVTIRNDVGRCYKEMAGGTDMRHVRFLCQEHEVVLTSLERQGREGEGQPKEKEKRTSAFVNEQRGDDNSHHTRARRTLGFIAEPGNRCQNRQRTSTFDNGKQDEYGGHRTDARQAPHLGKQKEGQLHETG